MVRYFTRLRVRRVYKWDGTPSSFDRKLKTYFFDSLNISVEGQPGMTTVTPGQYVLIEGDNEDNPFVAKLLKFFGDESNQQKKALVQWFVRVCEVPHNKKKLLGRSPHPQEVFYYLGHTCDNEIDAESILNTVQVQYVPVDAPFPEPGIKDTLYVKLSWDTKTFKDLDPALMQDTPVPASTPPRLKPASPCSPPAAALVSLGSVGRKMPTPDPMVMRRAGSVSRTRGPVSASKAGNNEAESVHSAAKLSASKTLSTKRRGSSGVTPGVRKKLQLSIGDSPEKIMSRKDGLCELLDEEVDSEKALVTKLNSSPRSLHHGYSLSPVRSDHRPPNSLGGYPLKPTSIMLDRLSPTALGEQDFSRDMLLGMAPLILEDEVFEAGLPTGTAKTPKKRQATPRRKYFHEKATTPSRRKDSAMTAREPSLGVLAEEDSESSPMQLVVTSSRSKRKSAQLVASRIRKQLNLMGDAQELHSDDGDDDCFTPSKKDLHHSSEEDLEDEEVSKSEETAGKTTRGRLRRASTTPARTPRKPPSKKATPSTPRTPRTPRHATPSIPSRTLPARKPGNVLEEARARLHVSSVPESLPCREQEFQDIYNFVESKVMDGTGGCMYISGVPGTGKTATVHEVIRCLQHASDMDEIPTFRFVEINGMKMTDPHQAYVQILQKLTDQKATADHAAALLEKMFSNPAPKKETTVLLVDELDLLWTRKQNVMYNLFDWPTRRHARLVVLTIANTMDLPERIMINRVASRLGLTRMSFQPYSFKQLQQIITSRLNKVKAFEEDALQLVSRKVAALSGDARRCLDICRRATEICEHSAPQPSSTGLVGMSHVMEALDEMFSSSYITAIRCASVQEQLFLRAVLAEFRRLGLEEATFQQVFVQHRALCRVEGLQPLSVSEGLAVCQRLGACRLLLLEASRLDVLQRVRLNVSQDDVLYALKADRA
ncbi:origin recognition complex subunit 1 isoform X2 [Esox lucius]|nr:origin recognition complex subunit 1 isoform X2 [Esox lucius]XP_010870636.2 origin recognition complex subunit 1 isoform X2 [Esox lucius]XP_010870637.2 origin recognition complex subunit 1 isoform X2 [Esox lucius]